MIPKPGIRAIGTPFIYRLIFTTLIFNALLSCGMPGDDQKIDSQDIGELKAQYGSATINYFYETVFHEDHANERRNNLHKWKQDPQIIIAGTPTPEEIGYVKDAASRINGMNLPVKCRINDQADTNVIRITFGSFEDAAKHLGADSAHAREANPDRHLAVARAISYDGIISEAHISIFYNKKDTLTSHRRNIVLEEIIQSMGVVGDSYSYPKSLFFQNYNPSKVFTPLDSNVLALLYDESIPFNYPIASFESDFGDLLFHVGVEGRIGKLLKSSSRDRLVADEIEACFTRGELLKHPKEVVVFLNGSVERADSATLEMAVASVNKISPDMKIRLAGRGDLGADYGISFNLIQTADQADATKISIENKMGADCMFPKLIRSNVLLSFNSSNKARTLRQRSIIEALFFSLVQLPPTRLRGQKLFKITDESIIFNDYYADLIKLVYSSEFMDGLKLSEFRSIKSRL